MKKAKWITAVLCLAGVGLAAAPRTGMTYAEAQARLPQRQLPLFWAGKMEDLSGRLSRWKTPEVRIIARSPGGRPLHLIQFGSSSRPPALANFNSAIGAHEPAAYCDLAARKQPVVLFLGPVHGHEVEALTGLVNLAEIMETGRDLRGRDQSGLQALGRRCLVLIIPAGNPDGTARFQPGALQGLAGADLRFWGQGTWSDHSFCDWPGCKRQHPMTGANTGFLGCYFNDQGINPMQDEFFEPMGPESRAILKVAKDTAPDLAVSLHSHESQPALLRPAYVPLEVQESVRQLARETYALLEQRGLPHAGPFTPAPEKGLHPEPFNLTSALYHISGAAAFTFECPHGLAEETACPASLEQILDIQLTLYEAMLRWALSPKTP